MVLVKLTQCHNLVLDEELDEESKAGLLNMEKMDSKRQHYCAVDT